jgi:hypothetical protein
MQIAVDGLVNGEAPRGTAGVLEVVEAERKRINRSTAAAIKGIEVERDRELKTLAQAAAVLGDKESEGCESPKEASRREPRRRRRVRENPIEAARERREAVYRYVSEKGGEVPTAEIRSALRMTTSSTAGALKRLCEEGRLKRTGVGSGTRYTPVAEGSKARRNGDGDKDGTVHGRILALVEDRGSASPEEVAQALRISLEEVQRHCGTLIREEEIHMARLNGQSVYVVNGAVVA